MLSNYGVSNNNTTTQTNNSRDTASQASEAASKSFTQSLGGGDSSGFGSLGGGLGGAGGGFGQIMMSIMSIIMQLLVQMQNSQGQGGEQSQGGQSGAGGNGGTNTAANAGNNAGAAGNTGAAGGTGTAGNAGAAGNNGGYGGNNAQASAAPEVSISTPSSTQDSSTVQFRDSNGAWQALDADNPPSQNIQPEDVRLVNNTRGNVVESNSGGAQIVKNGDSFTINFEDLFGSNVHNDNDFNDVSVTIKNAPAEACDDDGHAPAANQGGGQGQPAADKPAAATNQDQASAPAANEEKPAAPTADAKPAPAATNQEQAPAPAANEEKPAAPAADAKPAPAATNQNQPANPAPAQAPAAETAPSYPPVGISDGAKTWGDPHFVGAEGGKFDVQGEDGKTYNILSDKDIQINSEFKAWGNDTGATVMGEMGLTLGDDQVSFNADGELSVNGEAKGDGSYLDGAITKVGNQVKVDHGEYQLTINSQEHEKGNMLNIEYASENVAADGVMPHGIWGQTADGDGKARNGDEGHGAQGGGAIEGLDGEITESGDKSTVTQYEVGSLFDTSFTNFNRFDG